MKGTIIEKWTRAQCAEHWGIKPDTWSGYVSRGQAPQPIQRVGRTPLWDADQVKNWHRPGPGARTDLKERTMVTTTSYGTWNNRVDRHCLTVEQSVVEAFGAEGTDGFDVDAIVADYREAINRALPQGVTLAGDEFIGPYRPEPGEFDGYPVDDDGNLDIRAIVDGIDLWSIIERHATDEDTEQIVLVNANPGDEVPGVEISQLDDDKLTFLTREDVEGFFADCGYGPDNPDGLVFAFPAGEYTVPYGFPVQLFNVPASEAQAVRDAIRNA